MARDFLAIQAASVPSEATFSNAGRILDDYRSSLTPEHVEMLVVGENWLKQLEHLKLTHVK